VILDRLAETARERVAAQKKLLPLAELRAAAEALPRAADFPFARALERPGLSFVCEVKRASPSKGVIAEHFPHLDIARAYAEAGADAVSVLTEPSAFLGSDEHLRDIAAAVPLPVLRKDFTVDEYQIYEAKVLGAAAVLLIVALLPRARLREFLETARALGLSALVEAHTEGEIGDALAAGAKIVGVNNRDLRSFAVDLSLSERLGGHIPKTCVFVAESGVSSPEDAARLARAGADAVLLGEAIMRAADKRAFLRSLKEGAAREDAR
jgi:indole-3-glycerol phosphate synthase